MFIPGYAEIYFRCIILFSEHIPGKAELLLSYKNFIVPFYCVGSNVSSLQSHYAEIVYLLPLSPLEFLALI